MRFLLDTNILSALMKAPAGTVTEHISRVGQEQVFTSVIVMAEIEYGIERKQSRRLRSQFDALKGALVVMPIEQPADLSYARLRAGLELKGVALGQNDLWIAAQALSLNATLVTDDRAFLAIEELSVENWIR